MLAVFSVDLLWKHAMHSHRDSSIGVLELGTSLGEAHRFESHCRSSCARLSL